VVGNVVHETSKSLNVEDKDSGNKQCIDAKEGEDVLEDHLPQSELVDDTLLQT
jgi:hypothetical protein